MDIITAIMIITLSAISIICGIILAALGSIILIEEATSRINSKRRNIIFKDLEDNMIGLILSNTDIEFISYGDSDFFAKRNNQDVSGVIQYKLSAIGAIKLLSTAKNFKIFIRRKDKFSWTVLAHEYGHYLSIKNYNDDSEEGADYEALKWLRQEVLTPTEQLLLKLHLNIFFNENELKGYRHESKSVSTFKN